MTANKFPEREIRIASTGSFNGKSSASEPLESGRESVEPSSSCSTDSIRGVLGDEGVTGVGGGRRSSSMPRGCPLGKAGEAVRLESRGLDRPSWETTSRQAGARLLLVA